MTLFRPGTSQNEPEMTTELRLIHLQNSVWQVLHVSRPKNLSNSDPDLNGIPPWDFHASDFQREIENNNHSRIIYRNDNIARPVKT